jgi:hypothetical protein
MQTTGTRVKRGGLRLIECRGDWALVTGSSSGIGREFCIRLAAAGLNVVMVARRKDRLEDLAKELAAQHGIKTLVLPMDLSVPNSATHIRAAVAKEGIRIRLLCNNAAFGPWGRIEKSTTVMYEEMIQLIAAGTVSMCLEFFPDLTSFPTSAIINLSSPAALQPVPYKAVYSAAKVFVHNFSLALYGEWKERGVHVQTLIPGPTRSEFDLKGGAYPCALSEERRPPAEVVRVSLSKLEKDIPLVVTANGTYRQQIFASLCPTKMVIRTVARMFYPPAYR